MSENGKKFKINILSVLSTILLIPLVEKLLSPLYDIVIDRFLSVGNSGIQFISGFVYSRISEGVYINIPFYIFIAVMSVILSIPLCHIIVSYKESNSCCDSENIKYCEKRYNLKFFSQIKCLFLNSKARRYIAIISGIFLYVFFILFILTTNFINHTITRTMNNIEIVSPYIGDIEYKMLKSKFYSMRSRADFDNFNLLLEEYSSEFEVQLK